MRTPTLRRPPRAAADPARPRVRPPLPANVALTQSALLTLALVLGWGLLQVLVLGGIAQARAQDDLYSQFREDLARATAPVGGVIEPGAPVALLEIPAIGLSQVVVEGTASGDLMAGPGRRRDSALPGQSGVAVVYGRAATYGAPFAEVPSLRSGTVITTTTGQGRMDFRVEGVRRAGDPLPDPPDAGKARLTLVTGEGSGQLGSVSPGQTVYVDAISLGEAFAPGPRPAAVPASEKAMASETVALPTLALSLALLAGAILGLGVVRRRWPLTVTWLVGAPVVLSLSWLSTDLAVRLLPNLL